MFLANYNNLIYNLNNKKTIEEKELSVDKHYHYKYNLSIEKKYSNVEFLELYLENNNLPSNINTLVKDLEIKDLLFRKTFIQSKFDSKRFNYRDFLPELFKKQYLQTELLISKHIHSNFKKPRNYNEYLQMMRLLEDIKTRKVNHRIFSNIGKRYIDYNLFGTKTGRLTTKKNSFPILTISKADRKNITPSNDYFLEIDFNAFDPRIIIALNGVEQPKGDLHAFNAEKMNVSVNDRAKIKQMLFKHLYGDTDSLPESLNPFYGKDKILKSYYKDGKVTNFYGREIEADFYHAFSFIIQSTAADVFYRQALKIYDIVKKSNSFISMLIHDCLVIDITKEDLSSLYSDIRTSFSNSDLGFLPATYKLGTNLGNGKVI